MRARVWFGSAVVFAALWAVAVVPAGGAENPVKLAEGVYAYDAPGAGVNTGIVVGSKGVFVFNCDLRDRKERLEAVRKAAGGKPIKFVGNGHAAGDDIGCNGQFEDMGAVIISSQAMYEDLVAKATRYRKPLEKAGGRLVYPHVSFKDRLVLDLGSHKVHMISMGKGHTDGDTVVYLPRERVLFSTDLLFHQNHPTARDGDTANWQRILARFRTWEIEALVPGHGPVVKGRENVRRTIDALDTYFSELRGQVRAMMAAGKSLAEIKKGVDLKKYAAWGRKSAVPETIEKVYAELGGRAK